MKQTKRVPPGSLLRLGSWRWLVFLSIVSCTAMPPSKVYETPNALRTKLHGDVRTLNAVRPLDKLAAGGYHAGRGQGQEEGDTGQYVKQAARLLAGYTIVMEVPRRLIPAGLSPTVSLGAPALIIQSMG